jgi:hypothetical protein
VWEKNAHNGLKLHNTAEAAASSIASDENAGARLVTVYECVEVEIETRVQRTVVAINRVNLTSGISVEPEKGT